MESCPFLGPFFTSAMHAKWRRFALNREAHLLVNIAGVLFLENARQARYSATSAVSHLSGMYCELVRPYKYIQVYICNADTCSCLSIACAHMYAFSTLTLLVCASMDRPKIYRRLPCLWCQKGFGSHHGHGVQPAISNSAHFQSPAGCVSR